MERKVFLTVNCAAVSDDEFTVFVEDLERFIMGRKDRGIVPQYHAEQWLKKFIEEYHHWPGREFQSEVGTIQSYIQLDTHFA